MIRKIFCALTAVGALALAVGCEGSSSVPPKKDPPKMGTDVNKDPMKDVTKRVDDAANDVAKDVKGTADAGKEGRDKLAEVTTKELPAIETKINGLSGDAKTKATNDLTALKKAIKDAESTVTDSTKWKTAWDDVAAKLAALKKQVGL